MIRRRRSSDRAGFTLTEVLIGIAIMGVGLISVAVLFPIGLLRLQEAQRQSRSALLFESAAADMAARSLVNAQSFIQADLLNGPVGFGYWYACSATTRTPNGMYNPLIQDPASYLGNVYSDPTDTTKLIGLDAANANFHARGSAGLPFCYDPLWRYKVGVYLGDVDADGDALPEARFGSGIGFVRDDPDGDAPSAHGLQRLTNFNGRANGTFVDALGTTRTLFVMPSASAIPQIFVSPEDVVWNTANNPLNFSPVLPDPTLSGDGSTVNDWRFSWYFTGKTASASTASTFDGDLVICENRPFSLDPVPSPLDGSTTIMRPADEIVVEGVFGYGAKVLDTGGGIGYATAADRAVLLRWPAAMEDPIVKTGSWICDVTYERNQPTVATRFPPVPNPLNGGKWDNQPAQRAFWYQVVKTTPPVTDPTLGSNYRSMVVQVYSRLRARTPLTSGGTPAVVNAALIAPHVVNVIPQTIVVH